mgnify:FL=1
MSNNQFKSIFDKDRCPKSPNTNGLHEFVQTTTTVDGKDGVYYVCRYCGESADIVGKKVHKQQVDSLPAPGYSSDGCLLIPYTIETHYINYYTGSRYTHVSDCKSHTLSAFDGNNFGYIASYSCSSNSVSFRLRSGHSSFSNAGFSYKAVLERPYDGFYVLSTPRMECSYVLTDGTRGSRVGPVGSDGYDFGSRVGTYYSAGTVDTIDDDIYVYNYNQYSFYSITINFLPPVAKFTPAPSSDLNFENQYNITTRPTTITGGNLGIVGDNGQITTINNNQQIINETNNTYYNPATGQTSTITDWSYNYDGRIYTITLDTGDTVNVEYGDENITITENTINEGDTIVNNYTIYYIIDGGENPGPGPSGSPDPGPTVSVCPHIWKEVNRTEPGCTSPGTAQYICSQCGETKVETLKATGHTWQVLRTVQTAYDDEGNMIQQGYTIYQCSVCSEQYKDDQGTGPPGGPGDKDDDKETIWDKIANFFGSIVDGIAGIFEAILGKLLDALTALSEMLMGKVKDVVEGVLSVLDEVPKLFDGFLNFLGVVFPFIPAEITLLLTFGVIAVVFIGIIKALRR